MRPKKEENKDDAIGPKEDDDALVTRVAAAWKNGQGWQRKKNPTSCQGWVMSRSPTNKSKES
jgi:hypothetical protein